MAIPVAYSLLGTTNLLPGVPNIPEAFQVGIYYDAYHDPLATSLQNRYRWMTVPYPATWLYPSITQSMQTGFDMTCQLIRRNPGPFVLIGYSQGAAVASQVYDEIRYGTLQHRRDDFLGGLVCGNVCREAGHTIPGGIDPGGHGLRAPDHRLVNSEDIWWEFANEGDSACTIGDDALGLLWTGLAEWVLGDWDGGVNSIIDAAVAAFTDDPVETVTAIIEYLRDYLINPALTGTNPHLNYRNMLPIDGDSRTAFELAVEQLNALADTVSPSTTPAMCSEIWDYTRKAMRREEKTRRETPPVRIWDAEWDLQFLLGNEYAARFAWVANDSGPAQVELPFDSAVAQWIHDFQGRIDAGSGRNVFITVDYCGARWSGMMDKYSVEQRPDGDVVLVVDWLHDYEMAAKWYQIWSNPFMGAAFQFPRAFLLAGPSTWVLKQALFLNIFREHNPLVTIPDDPLDLTAWFEDLDQSNWAVVVKPESFLDAMASGVVWGVIYSRWQTWHDMAHAMLEDGELTVVVRRYLEGDDPPWAGADLRYGTLVLDIVDKSGVFVGTSHGGTIFDGLWRTIAEFSDDFIDSTLNLVEDTDVPQDYFFPNSKLTKKELPYVIFREGEGSSIEKASWINSPAKCVQISVGGHSAPGVNEAISATIQAIGDIVGGLAQIGSLGGTIDTLLQPLYEDTILAWASVKSVERAQNLGWSRYFEFYQGPAGKAFTIASLMVLRAGFWATKTTLSWEVEIAADGHPYMVGDNGQGHFFLEDRIGLVLEGDTRVNVDRCRKIELAWTEDSPPEWKLTVGDERIHQDPGQRAWGRIEQLVAGMKELGVW